MPGNCRAAGSRLPVDNPLAAGLVKCSDADIVAQILEGNAHATAHLLIHRCGPGLKYLVQHKYRTLGIEFNELVSELYLILRKNDWQALRAYRGANDAGRGCKLAHYIHCIAARWLFRKMGKAVKDSQRLVSLDIMERDVAASDTAGESAMTRADLVELATLLPDEMDRTVLLLYKIEGKEVSEVARLLNTSETNVYTRTSRAIQALRTRLATEGRR